MGVIQDLGLRASWRTDLSSEKLEVNVQELTPHIEMP